MNQKFCSKCGSQLEEDSVFCEECGNRAEQVSQTQGRQDSPSNHKPSGKDNSGMIKIIIGVLVFAVIALGVLKAKDYFSPSGSPKSIAVENTTMEMKTTEAETKTSEVETVPDTSAEASNTQLSTIETTEGSSKAEAVGSVEINADAPIDFSKLIVKQDGFSVNSDNTSYFNSLKKTPSSTSDLSGTWSGLAYFLGVKIEFNKTEVDDSYIKISEEDIKNDLKLSCDLSIDFTTAEATDKVMVNMTYDEGSDMGMTLSSVDLSDTWDFNQGVLTLEKDLGYSDVTCYGIMSKDNDGKQIMVILITINNEFNVNTDTNAMGNGLCQIEIYLTKK